jgi:hypothetical protein|tara:strand:- start:3487 stop:4230 length:744 start_codon:yes stop_codon:yes gene_type:complete
VAVEIILAIILMFFSGIWAAIKFVDEQTDNKLVFFVPAALLSLFVLSGIGDSFAFFACLLTFGPIIVMLVYVGVHQGTGKAVNYGLSQRKTRRNTQRIRSRNAPDLHRKLAPSYIRSYDRLIGYIEARGGAIKSREDGIRRLSEIWGVSESEVGRFFDSPYVIKVLDLKEVVVEENKQEVIGDEWWEEGYKVKSESNPSDNTDTGDLCGHPGCEKTVSAFDFRCYTCRGRFCPQHVGPNINCQLCSD